MPDKVAGFLFHVISRHKNYPDRLTFVSRVNKRQAHERANVWRRSSLPRVSDVTIQCFSRRLAENVGNDRDNVKVSGSWSNVAWREIWENSGG